eukprot:CAMPEP_0170760630 /NCGR_PEP_ID=MMETSP0733-20121128/1675_1 /TAXON_ID=186038 /ORGANISM="Fragilariopsis kerguelensis, Strain L26-C5" /LENGTH=403 /DNA_ID=CAMNT_0011100429 /DNA_START=38 /DNA_END=1249 /DNA_ORIENTATION=+
MALNEWSILFIYIGTFALSRILISRYYYLQGTFDVNGDGTISPDEVHFLNHTQNKPVVLEKPTYLDVSIMSMIRVFAEAMLHAFCYGSLVVFLMNICLTYTNMDPRYAYLMVVYMVQMGTMFMCKFAMTGIHVVTSNAVHFFYYGFGFMPLAFLWLQPEQKYLTAIAALSTLTITIKSRGRALPNYPNPSELTRIYQLDHNTGKWKLFSVPSTTLLGVNQRIVETQEILPADEPEFVPDGVEEGTLFEMAFVFPMNEILHTHISSHITIGILTALVTCYIVRGAFRFVDEASISILAISVLVTVVVTMLAQFIGLYGRAENKMHTLVLANYWPKTVAVTFAALGAVLGTIQLCPMISADDRTNTIMYWVGVGALITAIIVTYIQAVCMANITYRVVLANWLNP